MHIIKALNMNMESSKEFENGPSVLNYPCPWPYLRKTSTFLKAFSQFFVSFCEE
jgi:hypothetical protein